MSKAEMLKEIEELKAEKKKLVGSLNLCEHCSGELFIIEVEEIVKTISNKTITVAPFGEVDETEGELSFDDIQLVDDENENYYCGHCRRHIGTGTYGARTLIEFNSMIYDKIEDLDGEIDVLYDQMDELEE